MSINAEKVEIDAVVNRLLDNLSLTISSQTGREGIAVRTKIGDLRADYELALADGSFPTDLLSCFTTAREANAALSGFVNLRNRLFTETPVCDTAKAIVLAAIVFCLSAESRMIVAIEFVSYDDVTAKMKEMKAAFDIARELAADLIDSSSYQTLTFLAGSLTKFLATAARPLPRMITFNLKTTLPALTLSNLIYYTANRWEEVVGENKTIHPLFCQRSIRGLSA